MSKPVDFFSLRFNTNFLGWSKRGSNKPFTGWCYWSFGEDSKGNPQIIFYYQYFEGRIIRDEVKPREYELMQTKLWKLVYE